MQNEGWKGVIVILTSYKMKLKEANDESEKSGGNIRKIDIHHRDNIDNVRISFGDPEDIVYRLIAIIMKGTEIYLFVKS